MAKAVWTDAQIIDQLDSGNHWSGTSLTYSFASAGANSWAVYGETITQNLTAAQKAAAATVISLWDDLIAAKFTYTTDTASATIKYASLSATSSAYAYTYMPEDAAGTSMADGSVWFNSKYGASSGTNNLVTPTVGAWGFATYIHETGHALGLDHPGEYNGGSPTYASDALYSHDSQQYTIMSYFTAANTGADWVASDGRMYFAQTPMMDDIMTIQAMYGADTTTRATNTVYGYNSTLTGTVYDFSTNKHPVLCIYDAGGTDTLDLSGSLYAATINLEPGTFSNSDMMTSNISIARNTWIENATGGYGNDTISGNILDNVLKGGYGSDTLSGLAGNDTLDGGAGADKLIGGTGNDTYVVDNILDTITELSGEGTDLVLSSVTYKLSDNVENLTLTGISGIGGTGNALDNVLTGNIGDNTLDGGAGADTMIGGRGNDTYVVDNVGDVVIEKANEGTDAVRSSITYTLGDNVENLTLTGKTAINGTGNALDNMIIGNDAANVLSGGAGSDTLMGGAGNDVLIGGAGADRMYGGTGADTFRYTALTDIGDTVADFTSKTDHIEISAAAFGGGLVAGSTVKIVSVGDHTVATSTGTTGYFIFDIGGSDAGTLYWDATGGSSSDAVAVVNLTGVSSLSTSDIVIIA